MRIKRDGKFVFYTIADLEKMSRDELKILRQEIQSNIEEVSWKKSNYNATNDEEFNSKEYFKKIAGYKKVFAVLKSDMAKVNKIFLKKQDDEKNRMNHWLWCFYQNAKKTMKDNQFDELIKLSDDLATYHVDVPFNETTGNR